MSSLVRHCGHCGQTIAPRGGKAARFCPRCGATLDFSVEPQRPRSSAAAVTALLLGILALLTPLGVPLGIAAVLLGRGARRRIERSSGTLGGEVFAGVGQLLGIAALVFWGLALLANL